MGRSEMPMKAASYFLRTSFTRMVILVALITGELVSAVALA